jgi:hypothetical protein
MPTPISPTLPIELDRTRTLRLDFLAMSRFERATGEKLFLVSAVEAPTASQPEGRAREARAWDAIDNTASGLVAFVWAMLVHEDAALTVDAVGAMLNFGNYVYVRERVATIMEQAVKSNQESVAPGDVRPLVPPSASPGSPSGALVVSISDSPTGTSGD